MRIITRTAMAAALTVLAAASFVSIPLAAHAGEGCGGAKSVVQHIFDAADADRSGSLSPAEYSAAGLQDFGVSFAESDANGDGETSRAEYLELYERHHAGGELVSL